MVGLWGCIVDAGKMNELSRDNMYYDIIGDIHGHADKLEDLLLKLGYSLL